MSSTTAHIGRHFGAEAGLCPTEGEPTAVVIDRRRAERGIVHDTCLQCGVAGVRSTTRFHFTQLPGALLALLPLAVPMPVLFPVFFAALLLGRRRAEVRLPVCVHCASEHARGVWLRRLTAISTSLSAAAALPLIVLTPGDYAVVFSAWLSLTLASLGATVLVRKKTQNRVLLCEQIDREEVRLVVSQRWRLVPAEELPEGLAFARR